MFCVSVGQGWSCPSMLGSQLQSTHGSVVEVPPSVRGETMFVVMATLRMIAIARIHVAGPKLEPHRMRPL